MTAVGRLTRRAVLAGGSSLLVQPGFAAQTVLRIGDQKGQTGLFLVFAALHAAGLRSEDVQFVFLAPSDAKAAMMSGSVDSWATWGPYIA